MPGNFWQIEGKIFQILEYVKSCKLHLEVQADDRLYTGEYSFVVSGPNPQSRHARACAKY